MIDVSKFNAKKWEKLEKLKLALEDSHLGTIENGEVIYQEEDAKQVSELMDKYLLNKK